MLDQIFIGALLLIVGVAIGIFIGYALCNSDNMKLFKKVYNKNSKDGSANNSSLK